MKFQSKKDETIFAIQNSVDAKYRTTELTYVSGPNEGKSFVISESTLKRWWKLVNEGEELVVEEKTTTYGNIDEPYPEPKTQKFIPKPESVIKYEEKQHKNTYNTDLPTQDDMVEEFGKILSKINKTYIVFQNKCWLERKSGYINLYATDEVWQLVAENGLTSRINGMKNTALKFVVKIENMEQYNIVAKILKGEM